MPEAKPEVEPIPNAAGLSRAMSLVEEYCSPDPARQAMAKPFPLQWRGAWWLAATDGARAALVRCDEAEALKPEVTPPPLGHVLDQVMKGLKACGDIDVRNRHLDGLRAIPKTWDAWVAFGKLPDKSATLTAQKRTGSGKKERTVTIVINAPIPWQPKLEPPRVCAYPVHQLLDALDTVGTNVVRMHTSADELGPAVFCRYGVELAQATMLVVVMPVRL